MTALWCHPVARALRAVLPLLLLGALLTRLGADPFVRAVGVVSPLPVGAALVLVASATVAQAMRWRLLVLAHGGSLTRAQAVRECYRGAVLNTVLPGGMAGDAVRAWRHREPSGPGLRDQVRAAGGSAALVVADRAVGTGLLLLTAAGAAVRVQPAVAAGLLIAASVAAGVALPTLRRLSVAGLAAVLGWSLLLLAAVTGLFAVSAATLGAVPDAADITPLGLVVLAGMSLPSGVAGFGPREAVAALAFAAAGLTADAGVATAAAYGVLVALSAAPGALVVLVDARRGGRRVAAQRRQVELHADVVAQHEPA